MTEQSKATIVLIHGLWMTPLSWEHWVERYSAAGYRVETPAWPGFEGDVEAIRADTSAIENLGLEEIIDHMEEFLGGIEGETIIMGHSFGGAITEVLLDHGHGDAGVAIDAASVRGVTKLPLSTLRSSFPILKSPANGHRAVPLTAGQFHYAFTNTMSEEESRPIYERYAVPGPGRVLWQGALANFNPHTPLKVDFKNPERAPLLLIAGGSDHVIPPSVDKQMAKKESKAPAVTDYKEFPGRSHFTVGQEGWEEVADYALDWAQRQLDAAAPA
ncbi:MAG TPA: alpha/beta hydrolase [Solirubrobacterales bacterium]|nr:alpha/beta hydrolase [Solirubrobacterales bacterium]